MEITPVSCATLSGPSLTSAQQQFTAALPRMDQVFRSRFRRWPPRDRAEAIATARAVAWVSWCGLVRRGRNPLEVGAAGIAYHATHRVRAGRPFGYGKPGPHADVMSHRTQREHGFELVLLDQVERDWQGMDSDEWRDVLAADHRTTPADAACFDLDFRAWLAGLPHRKKWIAERLAEGFTTSELARELGVTLPLISQTRTYLATSWAVFQGEPDASNGRRVPARRGTIAGCPARAS
jgi:hypothetical protein